MMPVEIFLGLMKGLPIFVESTMFVLFDSLIMSFTMAKKKLGYSHRYKYIMCIYIDGYSS